MTYPGPPANLKTWDSSAAETITTPILRNDVTNTVWYLSSPPFFSGQAQTTQSIPNNANTPVDLDAEIADPLGEHSDSVQTWNVYAAYDGWYLGTGFVRFNTTTTGVVYACGIGADQNSVVTNFNGQQTPTQATFNPGVICCELAQLATATSDRMFLNAYQDTGGAVDTLASASNYPTLNSIWVATASAPPGWSTSLPVPANTAFADGTEITGTFMNTAVRDTVNFLQYPPVARIARTSSTQIATTTFPAGTAIPFTAATVDNWGGWAVSPNPTRYTFQAAGLYFVYGQACYAGDTTGQDRAAGLRVNGGTTQWGGTEAAVSGVQHNSPVCQMIRAAANDYVELMGHSNVSTGGGITVTGTTGNSCRLIVWWLAS